MHIDLACMLQIYTQTSTKKIMENLFSFAADTHLKNYYFQNSTVMMMFRMKYDFEIIAWLSIMSSYLIFHENGFDVREIIRFFGDASYYLINLSLLLLHFYRSWWAALWFLSIFLANQLDLMEVLHQLLTIYTDVLFSSS